VLKETNADGLRQLRKLSSVSLGDPREELRDIEALLIRALGLVPNLNTRFANATAWTQVRRLEAPIFLEKIRG